MFHEATSSLQDPSCSRGPDSPPPPLSPLHQLAVLPECVGKSVALGKRGGAKCSRVGTTGSFLDVNTESECPAALQVAALKSRWGWARPP